MAPRFSVPFLLGLFLSVNALASSPIVLAPTGEGSPLMPEGRGPVPQGNPSVASDGHRWFAVWEDERYRNVDVFATGIGAAGEVLHPEGMPLAPTFAPDRDPQIVWTGDRYLAAFVNDLGIFTVRLSADGAHLGSGLSVPANGAESYAPTFATGRWLAWNGDRALVAWHQAGGPDELRVALLDRDGSMMTNPIPIAAAPRAISMAVAADGEGFLLAWESTEGTTATLRSVVISAEGTAGTIQTIGTFARRQFGGVIGFAPVIAVQNGTRILLWTDGGIRGVRLGDGGEPLESPFTVVETEGGLWSPGDVVPVPGGWIAAVGGGPLVDDETGYRQWETDAFLLRLGDDGRPLGSRVSLDVEPGSRRDPAIALAGEGRLFVAWEEEHVVRGGVFGAGLEPLEDARPLGLGLTDQTSPKLTPHGTAHLLAWREGGGRVAMVSASGELAGPVLSFAQQPFVASTGQTALLVWTDREGGYANPRAMALRLRADGTALDSAPWVLADGFSARAVGSDGVGFVVVLGEPIPWGPYPTYLGDRLWTAPVSSSGLAGARQPLAPLRRWWQDFPVLDWTGNHYLVVWSEREPCIAGHCVSDLYAMPVSAGGVPLASESKVVTATPSRSNETASDVACGDHECAVVSSSPGRVLFLSREGDRLDVPLSDPGKMAAAGIQAIEWDELRYVVGEGALAPLPGGAVLRVVERTLVPLPLAHEGYVMRLYVDRVIAGRHRVAAR